MNIFIDESGSFVNTDQPQSWNVVAGVATAESARRQIAESIHALRRDVGASSNTEVKLNAVSEPALIRFLTSLQHQGIVVFAVATDSEYNTLNNVRKHQAHLIASTRTQISEMKYEGGRLAVAFLADQLASLPPQLYVQLICQVRLIQDIISRSINYFVQRQPGTLREIRWRIDQKNSERPTFEEAFMKIAPPLLQSRSIDEPIWTIREFDYSSMKAYELVPESTPDYLQTEYGLPPIEGFDLQKLLRGNLRFVDSRSSEGVQVADLVAGTIRRLLRKRFELNAEIADALAPTMLQNQRGRYPILLTGFTDEDTAVDKHVASLVRTIAHGSKNLLLPTSRGDA